MRLFRWLLLSFVMLGIAEAAPMRVLFIGNSLTAANDVPALVEAMAKSNGDQIVTRTIAYPNFSLEDHWQKGDARRVIAEGGWSYIVLQQGPSSLAESRVLLVEYAKHFAADAKRIKARVAFFMVWPEANRLGAFDQVKLSYQTAAQETGGVFLPAGQAWRLAWAIDPKLAFYGPDGYHPTFLGSYLSALVIYQGLSGKPPARFTPKQVSEAQKQILEQAASKALTSDNK